MADVVLKGLRKRYGGAVDAVKGIDLECRDKEFMCFLGPSGCGKTSTLRMVAGLEDATAGDILIGGRRVNDLPSRERGIAMVFENYALYKYLSVYDNIAFPLRIRRVDQGRIREKVNEVAQFLAIEDILCLRADSLSGGQQQRVGIARALVRDADVLLMDEPISHLEARLRARTRTELKRLQRSVGITTLYVTHDQLEAMALADRIAIMNLGELQQVGTPLEIFDWPRNEFVAGFVGEPPMNLLDGTLVADEGSLQVAGDGYRVQLPPAVAHSLRALPVRSESGARPVHLGIRPIDLTVQRVEPADGSYLAGRVTQWEPRNDSAIVTVAVGRAEVQSETDMSFRAELGETVWLLPDVSRLHLFDPRTTLNMLADTRG